MKIVTVGGKKNLGIRADQDRWKQINQLAYRSDTSIQKLVDAAIDQVYFGKRRAQSRMHGPSREVQRALARAIEVIGELHQLLESDYAVSFDAHTDDLIKRTANGE